MTARLPAAYAAAHPKGRPRSGCSEPGAAQTLSAAAWSPAWRGQAATSPACRPSRLTLRASGSSSCASLSPAHDIERLGPSLEHIEGGRDILGALADFHWDDVEAERAGRRLRLIHLQHGAGIADIGHDRQPAQTEALAINNRIRIHTLSLAARLPTPHGSRDNVEAGGLMSYGPSYADLFAGAWPAGDWL